jgi:hypothetical protein
MKQLEEYTLAHQFRQWFFLKCNTKKQENRQIGLLQTKKALHSQGKNQQSEETTYRMGEKFSNCL